ncbi:hypothetical protein [Haliangium sp.]|uniref:hypothetical protein n=1 Tax=Haliangium sp. TaxID=2663208 RepID=UPI003D0FAABE
MQALFRSGVLFSLLAAAGCQTILGIGDVQLGPDGGGGGGDIDARPPAPDAEPALPDASQPSFTFAILTPTVTVPLDGTNVIDVEIVRRGGFDGEVTVMPASPPTGLVAQTIRIPAGETRAELPVGAVAPLVLGDTISFGLVANGTGVAEQSAMVNDAQVTGRPGTLDLGFGELATGYAAISFGNDDGGAFYDLEITGDNKILALGWTVGGLGALRIALTRLLPNGAIDPNFGGGNLVRTDFESGSSGEGAQAYAVGRQVDGRIISIGWHRAPNFPPDVGLIRFGVNGAVGDLEFGNHKPGKSRIDLGGDEEIYAGDVLANSQILAAGVRDGRLVVTRATTTGELDTSFASPFGYQTLAVGTASRANALVVDRQDRIVVAGFVDVNGQRDMVVVRYLADGTPDASFGNGGVVVAGDATTSETAAAVAIRPDGRILVAGQSNVNGDVDVQLRQFLPDGAPDPDFGTDGVSTPRLSTRAEETADMALLPDGRALIVGNLAAGGGNTAEPVVLRYRRDGTLDPYFDDDGVLSLYIGEQGVLQAVELHPGSQVVISGGNEGGTPGPGTFGIVVRMWM